MKKATLILTFLIFVLDLASQTPFQSLNFLYKIQGAKVVAGQHNDQKNLECGDTGTTGATYWSDQVEAITGKTPALYSADFLFHGSDSLRWEITREAARQWNKGALVNLMWHACPPNQGESCNWQGGLLSALGEEAWQQLLADGSPLNEQWKRQVNEVAIYLKRLKVQGVEVLWRPYHEQNQTLFWWNSHSPEYTKRLWRMLHDYMTIELELTNLIWVWDVQDIKGQSNYSSWNPGEKYWDILALDIYSDAYENDEYYDQMLEVAGGRPIAIGECFKLPSSEYLASHKKIAFFMTWAYGLKKGLNCEETNTEEYIRSVYSNPSVLTLDEMPGWR